MTDTSVVDYDALFESLRQFKIFTECFDEGETITALETVANVFGISTYDGAMDAHFASMILRVLKAIVSVNQVEFLKCPGNYMEYCTVICFGGVRELLSWGTSPRGAWFNAPKNGWFPDSRIGHMSGATRIALHDKEQFKLFVYAMITAVEKENNDAN